MELLAKSARVRVQPLFEPLQMRLVSRDAATITIAHLNASALAAASPRYVVCKPPRCEERASRAECQRFLFFFLFSWPLLLVSRHKQHDRLLHTFASRQTRGADYWRA